MPSFLFVALTCLFFGFRFFREISLLEGRYPTPPLYMLQHFMRNVFAVLDYQKLCAAAVLLFVLAALALGLPAALLRKRSGGVEFLSFSAENGSGGRGKHPALAAALVVLLVIPGLLPTVVTLVHSLAPEAELGARYTRILKQIGFQDGPVKRPPWRYSCRWRCARPGASAASGAGGGIACCSCISSCSCCPGR